MKKPSLFKKTNYIIEAKYKLGVMETFLFTQAYMTISDEEPTDAAAAGQGSAGPLSHRIYFKDVIQNFGLHPKGDTYDNILKAARSLRSREIVFRPVNEAGEEAETEIYTGFFTKVKVHKRKNNDLACLEVFIDEDLKPHLIALKRYTLLNKDRYAWIVGCLRNPLIVRLYDLLKQYEKIGWRRFSVAELKTILQIDDKYALYGSFKQKVLSEAQQLFEKYADIVFDLKEEKSGKAVESLHFTIAPNLPSAAPDAMREQIAAERQKKLERAGERPPAPTDRPPLFDELWPTVEPWGVSEKAFLELLKTTDEKTVRNGLAATREKMASPKPPESPAGFFVKAVRDGWRTTKQIKIDQFQDRKKREADAQKAVSEKAKPLQIQLEALFEARRLDINQVIRDLTARDATVAVRAVQGIKDNAATVRFLKKMHGIGEMENLSMDDFRKNEALREQVIAEIIRQQPELFEPVRLRYEEPILELQARLKKILS